MSSSQFELLGDSDWNALYQPVNGAFIEITGDGGNIGRFHWHNQGRYTIEQFNADGTLYNRESWEIPGGFAFVWTIGDYIALLMS